MRTCSRCGAREKQNPSAFSPSGTYCRPCHTTYYREHKAEMDANARRWHEINVKPVTAARKAAKATARQARLSTGIEAEVWCSCKRFGVSGTGCLHTPKRRRTKDGMRQRAWMDTKARMLDEQGRRCGICGTDDPRVKAGTRWHLDHEHTTGRLRGVLCADCNLALGMLRDNATLAERAAAYLRRGGTQPGGFEPVPYPHRRKERKSHSVRPSRQIRMADV